MVARCVHWSNLDCAVVWVSRPNVTHQAREKDCQVTVACRHLGPDQGLAVLQEALIIFSHWLILVVLAKVRLLYSGGDH